MDLGRAVDHDRSPLHQLRRGLYLPVQRFCRWYWIAGRGTGERIVRCPDWRRHLFPVSLRANVGLRGKAGVYANFSERSTFLSNGGNLLLNAGDSEVGVAGQFEMGIFANYQIVPSIRLTAGYEAWYLPQMATVTGQNPASITTSNGASRSQPVRLQLFFIEGLVG